MVRDELLKILFKGIFTLETLSRNTFKGSVHTKLHLNKCLKEVNFKAIDSVSYGETFWIDIVSLTPFVSCHALLHVIRSLRNILPTRASAAWSLTPGWGVLPEKLGRGVRPASQNLYPIFDQNLWFSLPYLWPDQKFDTLFMTWLLDH